MPSAPPDVCPASRVAPSYCGQGAALRSSSVSLVVEQRPHSSVQADDVPASSPTTPDELVLHDATREPSSVLRKSRSQAFRQAHPSSASSLLRPSVSINQK
uniref:Uncharacterized protein n=1 Tax=Heliothis virescens TaxID=7102 RepID=A0A2A4J3K7_HELVI